MNEPTEPMTVMAQACAVTHEMFTSWMTAGFTEDQALKLVAYWLVAVGNNGE